jgi:hypothetical protein
MLISHHCRSFDRISLFSRFFFSLPQSFMPFWYTVSMSIAVAGIPRPAKLLARLITVVTLSRRYPFHDFSNPAQPSSVQYGYICCGRVDNRSIECPVKSYQQTRSSGAEINSDALSILMTNCLTSDSEDFRSFPDNSSPSTRKLLVLLLLSKNKNDLPLIGSRIPLGTDFSRGRIS